MPPQEDTGDGHRLDFDDAPPPLKKRWIVIAAGLAVATAATAVVIASVGPDDALRLPDADPTPSWEESRPDDDLDPDRAVARCQTALLERQVADGAREPAIPPAPGDADVLYLHTTDDYVVVGVSDGGQQAVCGYNADGDQRTGYTEDGVAGHISQLVLLPENSAIEVNLLFAGRVDRQVTNVEVRSDRREATQADMGTGFFSVWVPVEMDENLDYVITLRDGSTESQAVDFGGPPEGTAAATCFEGLDIDLPVPSSQEDPGADTDSGEYRFVAEHWQRAYTLGVATDGEDIKACAVAPGASPTTWEASQPRDMVEGALISPFEPSPEATQTGPYPVIGQAAPEVVSVEVIRADGRSREAYLLRGLYSVMLPAAQSADLTYLVTTEDGETTTLGSG